MNHKFKISNPSFSITNDSVYCILSIEDIPQELYELTGSCWRQEGIPRRWSYFNKKCKELMTKVYIGVARKKIGDIDNIEIAKEIACKKARRQCLKEINNFYRDVRKQLTLVYNGISSSEQKNIEELFQINDRINCLTKSSFIEENPFPSLQSNSIGLMSSGKWFSIISTHSENEFIAAFEDGTSLWINSNEEGQDIHDWIDIFTGSQISPSTNLVVDKIIYINSNMESCNYQIAKKDYNFTLKSRLIYSNYWFRYRTLDRYYSVE